jgi:hypothetical protein
MSGREVRSPDEQPLIRGPDSSAPSRRPGSSPGGASQLRDSAGFTPDFADCGATRISRARDSYQAGRPARKPVARLPSAAAWMSSGLTALRE